MKTSLKAIAGVTLGLLMIPTMVFAGNYQQSNHIYIPKDQIIEDNFFAAGERIDIEGTIDGDLYVAGGTITVDGTVSGDILAAGGTIILNGPVQGDIRVAGGTVTVNNIISKNATVFGGTVLFSKDSAIGEGVVTTGGLVEHHGTIEKSLFISGGEIVLDGKIGKHVKAFAEDILLLANANIKGDFDYTSPVAASIKQGSQINGEVIMNSIETKNVDSNNFHKLMFFFHLICFISALIFGLLMIKFVPKLIQDQYSYLKNNFWKTTGYGGLLSIIFPALGLLLMISLLGIPFTKLLFAIWIFIALFATVISSIYVGDLILQKVFSQKPVKKEFVKPFVLGSIILFIICFIPVLGMLARALFILAGMGACFKQLKSIVKQYQ